MNIYNVLAKAPLLKGSEMPPDLERLAKQLVYSGKLRIDAGPDKMNFVRFTIPTKGIEVMFSDRELNDSTLVPITKKRIEKLLAQEKNSKRTVASEIKRLRTELKKYQPIKKKNELKLARMLVQSTHPAVFMLLLWEEVDVFISYSHSIGDMLDMKTWEEMGCNSGMQSTAGKKYTVFVSTGGDPFLYEKDVAEAWDGLAAIARLIIIAAQELGHYADIKRDSHGHPIGRHSALGDGSRAKDHVKKARRDDIKRLTATKKKLNKIGLKTITEKEKQFRIFQKHPVGFIEKYSLLISLIFSRKQFFKNCKKEGLSWVSKMPKEKDAATQMTMMLADMAFNLAPKADAYRREDLDEEEAIACIEALARVPQQARKWGFDVTKALMHDLYHIYFSEVIPACIKSYQEVSGTKFRISEEMPEQQWWQRVVGLFQKKQKRPKPDF